MLNTVLGNPKIEFSTQRTVLIVEDDDQIADFLQYLFERQDYEVTIVPDGKQGLEFIASQERVDLVIMDVKLPYVGGFELVKEIRDSEEWKSTKIVMLTSMHQEKDIIHGLHVGADEFVCKPFQPNELIARVQKIMQKDFNK